MSVSKLRIVLSCVCVLIGYSILGAYALSLRFGFGLSTNVYWLSFVFVSLPLLYEIAVWKSGAKMRLFYLLMFSLMVTLQYAVVDSSPFLSSSDAVGDYRLTGKIIEDARWRPFTQVEWYFGSEYRFYPVTDFLYATMSLLTGIPLLVVVKYLFIVKALAVTLLVERWFRSLFRGRVAYLATVLFLASPGAMLFPHKESFAMIFFFAGLYVATRTRKTRQHLLIGLISMFTLVMTHHFTTYIFLFLLTSLYLASVLFEGQGAVRVSSGFYVLCLITFITWVAFVASAIISWHQRMLWSTFFETLLPGELTFSELLPLYSQYERIVVWLGYGITLVSTGLGFLVYMRNRKNRSSSFLTMVLFLAPLLVVASIARFSGREYSILISHRSYEFGYIAIGTMSAFIFVRAFQSGGKMVLKIVLAGAIICMIIVGPIAGSTHPRTFARISKVISVEAMALNTWTRESGANNEYAVGDRVLHLVLTGYGNSLVLRYAPLFASQSFDLPPDLRSRAAYVVTYTYMTDLYGPNAAKFYTSPYFQNIYSNGVLDVFRMVNRIQP